MCGAFIGKSWFQVYSTFRVHKQESQQKSFLKLYLFKFKFWSEKLFGMNSNSTFLTFVFLLLLISDIIKAQSPSNFVSINEICKSRNGITNEEVEMIFTFFSSLISKNQKCFLSCHFRSNQIVSGKLIFWKYF